MHDAAHVVYVDAASGDVGGYQRLNPSLLERRQRPITLPLAAVAVDGHGRHAHVRKLLSDPVRTPLGAAEHHCRTVLFDQTGGELHPLLTRSLDEIVDSAVIVAVGRGNVAADGFALIVAHQDVDGAVEGRREQQRLAAGLHLVEQAPHLGKKTHVRHTVGLVDDDDVDVGEDERTAAHEIADATRTADGHVDPAAEGLELRAEAHTAIERSDAALADSEQRLELGADLGCQLASRRQHKRPGTTWSGPRHPLGDGKPEGEGLARSGGGPAADVVAVEGGGDGRRLNGEGFGPAALGEARAQVVGHAEIGEASGGRGG